jgi:hypothetical protein
VWEMAAERDRLRAQLEAAQSRPAAADPAPTANRPEVRPPAILPIAIPVPEAVPDVNMLVPETNGTAPATNQAGETDGTTGEEEEDCSGANANQLRCRPGRWNRPVPQRPLPRTQPDPQPGTPGTPPRGD